MSFMDKLRMKAEELGLETKAKDLQEATLQAAKQAREKAGDFTVENREKIDGYVETATTKIDEKTEGKYADKLAKVKVHVGRGVDKVAEGHATGASTATGAAAAAGAADVAGRDPFPPDPDSPPAPVSASPLEAPSPIDAPPPPAPGGASPLEAPSPITAPTPVDESGFDAASGDLPVPVQESLADTTLE